MVMDGLGGTSLHRQQMRVVVSAGSHSFGLGRGMRLRPLFFLAIAIGLFFVSHALELRGDAAPFAENGVSSERATYHLSALVLVIGALGFFVAAGIAAFRKK